MPGSPESTPRIAVEAKALNCKLVAPKNLIGVAKLANPVRKLETDEYTFKLKLDI